MSEQAPRQRGGRNAFRTLAAVSTAAILLGSSFYAAQAGSLGSYEDDGDTDTAKVVGISLGAAAGVFLLAGAIDRSNDGDSSSEEKAKSAKAGSVEQVRVVPSRTGVTSGDATVLSVQARYSGSNTWQDVTNGANLRLVSGGLSQVDGSKNAFAVPYGQQVTPGAAVIEATYGGKSATTEVSVN